MGVSKTFGVKLEAKSILKEVVTSEPFWWTHRTRITSHRKVEQYTGICVTGYSVMISTKGSLQGPLGKDLRNISGFLPPFMTMPTPQLILTG